MLKTDNVARQIFGSGEVQPNLPEQRRLKCERKFDRIIVSALKAVGDQLVDDAPRRIAYRVVVGLSVHGENVFTN